MPNLQPAIVDSAAAEREYKKVSPLQPGKRFITQLGEPADVGGKEVADIHIVNTTKIIPRPGIPRHVDPIGHTAQMLGTAA